MVKMESLNYIITAKHYAKKEGAATVKERILRRVQKLNLKCLGIAEPKGDSVKAFVDFGQWIAKCSCGGYEFVDYNEPIFYCFSCGNRKNDNWVRPVEFPDMEKIKEIESLLLQRPVNDEQGLTDEDRAYRAIPLITTSKGALSRSWNSDETIEDLKEQNKEIKKWLGLQSQQP
jgi:hypothetical protein